MTGSNWSVPETEVRREIRERLDDPGVVLATIVNVEGNAYRRPGAKMLLDADGSGVGNITAGCLEAELVEASETVRETGRPRLVTYDLTGEDDVWGLGVGCDGIIDVLLDPLGESYRPAAEAFADRLDVAAVTVLEDEDPLDRGDRAYYYPDEDDFVVLGDNREEWPTAILRDPAAELASNGRASVVDLDDRGLSVFVDGLRAPDELVIFGSGHDVGPVAELGARVDFRVTVVGFRGGVDLDERFPQADRTVTTTPGKLADDVELTDRTYAVVMTHNFVDDRLTVEELLDSPIPYVGLMGPPERFAELREVMADDGSTLTDEELDRVYAPVGLDLGGGSPYQIGHSIVAEVISVSNDRRPRHLRERNGHIHERVEVEADGGNEPET